LGPPPSLPTTCYYYYNTSVFANTKPQHQMLSLISKTQHLRTPVG
jgi:hypothetical protein